MSNNKKHTWNTKFGPRRVRHEPPTLAEAIAAAQGLSDELNEQTEIAASLMGLPGDQVRLELLKMTRSRRDTVQSVVFMGPASSPRAITVERKSPRRFLATGQRAERPALIGRV
jgi:hypothetical protein